VAAFISPSLAAKEVRGGCKNLRVATVKKYTLP
jgi:hypothetical protein